MMNREPRKEAEFCQRLSFSYSWDEMQMLNGTFYSSNSRSASVDSTVYNVNKEPVHSHALKRSQWSLCPSISLSLSLPRSLCPSAADSHQIASDIFQKFAVTLRVTMHQLVPLKQLYTTPGTPLGLSAGRDVPPCVRRRKQSWCAGMLGRKLLTDVLLCIGIKHPT